MFERRHNGTGEWLIKHPEFQKWIEGETHVLWCPGDRTTVPTSANLSQRALGKLFLRSNLREGC